MRECATCGKRIYDEYMKTKTLEFEDEKLHFCEHCIEVLEQFESLGVSSSHFRYIEWDRVE